MATSTPPSREFAAFEKWLKRHELAIAKIGAAYGAYYSDAKTCAEDLYRAHGGRSVKEAHINRWFVDNFNPEC